MQTWTHGLHCSTKWRPHPPASGRCVLTKQSNVNWCWLEPKFKLQICQTAMYLPNSTSPLINSFVMSYVLVLKPVSCCPFHPWGGTANSVAGLAAGPGTPRPSRLPVQRLIVEIHRNIQNVAAHRFPRSHWETQPSRILAKIWLTKWPRNKQTASLHQGVWNIAHWNTCCSFYDTTGLEKMLSDCTSEFVATSPVLKFRPISRSKLRAAWSLTCTGFRWLDVTAKHVHNPE